MTGEPKPEEEPDFLDDFILEDVPPAKDLESLFDAQAGAAPSGAPSEQDSAEQDTLFTDHSKAAAGATEKFEGGPPFSETGSSTWRGDALELEKPGAAAERAMELERGRQEEAAAKASFAKELDSLLHREDEVAIEADKELELDETDDSLLDEAAGGAEAAEAGAEDGEQMPLEVTEDEAPVEPGWEPLAATSMDQLSEVGVERVEGQEQATAEYEDNVAAVAVAEAEEMYAEGVDATPAEVVGGRKPVPLFRLLASLAASLALVAAAALFVLRPELLGLRSEPEQVASVQVQRPRLEISVGVPPLPQPEAVVATAPVTPTDPTTPGTVVDPTPSVVKNDPPPVDPTPTPTPTDPSPTPTVATGPEVPGVINVPSPGDAQKNWPVAVSGPTPANPANPLSGAPGLREGLVRVSDDMLVGDQTEGALPVDGMLPGSKAFAQLHNGNYFIGSVKATDPQTITLRLEKGEITLVRAELTKLTSLGSADYEELQRVTSGFVRLRNNNRLVGSILSSIADDHIVLEFRSNRVMVPKNAIDEVVKGEGDGGVRLGTTREEDDWVRQLSERQLGQPQPGPNTKGAGNAVPPAPPRDGK